MIRNLLVITGVGFGLAVVGIGGACALVKNDIAHNDWTWVVTDDGPGDDSFRFERGQVDPEVSRALAWTGGDRLSIDLPGEVTYVQGEQAGVRITGPRTVVDRVRLDGGRLSLDGAGDETERGYLRWDRNGIRAWSSTDALKIVVTAPSVDTFIMGDDGHLAIRDYDRPTLDVTLEGDGDVEARGRTTGLKVNVSGNGEADMARLQVTNAEVDLSGYGDVRMGPTGRADIDISGHGDVTLTRNPDQLNQSVSGWGEVEFD